jgi:hypothetical protein
LGEDCSARDSAQPVDLFIKLAMAARPREPGLFQIPC